MEEVILVDQNDLEIGTMEKMEAHRKGLLHRAFSVFIFNSMGEILLQRRAATKYHSGGLWTNTCCSHPRPGETTLEAAHRRLEEEMGMNADLSPTFHFIYRAELDQGLIEHELDHVFTGVTDELPVLNHDETDEYKYVSADEITSDIQEHPERYTEWFKIIFKAYRDRLNVA